MRNEKNFPVCRNVSFACSDVFLGGYKDFKTTRL